MNRFEAQIYYNKVSKSKRRKLLDIELKKSVEHGKGGTLHYIIKKGPNKGKVL